jgi:hypothetical protein
MGKNGVARVIFPFTEGSMQRLHKLPGGVASISCRKKQIQHNQETLTFSVDVVYAPYLLLVSQINECNFEDTHSEN